LDDNYFTFYQNVNNVITGSALNFDCFYKEKTLDLFYFKTITLMLSPFILHIFVSLSFLAFFYIKKFFLKKQVTLSSYFKIILIAFIVVCDTQYTQLLVSLLKLFECVILDSTNPNTYLRFAPHIQCYTSEHINYCLWICLPCLIIWIIGLPLIFFIVLYLLNRKCESEGSALLLKAKKIRLTLFERVSKQKETNKKEKMPGAFEIDLDATLMLSFLFYDYKKSKYYWTSVILIWKTLISVIVTFVDPESIYVILFGFYVLLLMIYRVGQPYNHQSTMFLINISLLCNLISIVLGQYVANEIKFKNEVVLINLSVHLFFFVMAIYLYFREFDYKEIFEKTVKVLKKKEDNRLVKNILQRLKYFDKYNFIDIKDIAKDSVREDLEENDINLCSSKSGKSDVSEDEDMPTPDVLNSPNPYIKSLFGRNSNFNKKMNNDEKKNEEKNNEENDEENDDENNIENNVKNNVENNVENIVENNEENNVENIIENNEENHVENNEEKNNEKKNNEEENN